MTKKKQQKQSRYAAYNYAAHAQNAAEINRRDREYYESLSEDEKRKTLEEKRRSEEAYRQWEKESEDSSSTSGGIWNSIKNTASAVAESAKNAKWSDFADAYRMWTQDLVSLHKDEALEHIRENNQQQEEIKMMAKYKQLALLKSDLETQLNNIDDPNSEEASDVLNRLNVVAQELSNYDQYFLNEGRSSIPIQQQMFDFNKLSSFEKSYLHDVYALHDVKSAPKATGNFFEDLSGSINQAVKNIGNTLWGGLDALGKDLYGVVDHYVFGNGYSYDQYVLGKAMEYLDKDDPILKKAYKGNNLLSTKVAESIDGSAVGEYKQNEYTQGDWFNQAQRWKNEYIEDYKQNKQFLKDGKLHFWGASKDGIDIVDFEDINPQFKKEHEQYGGSFTDIVAHPLHGLVETNATVGMLEHQLKAGGSVALAKLAAREIPAIAALSVIADITEPGAMLWAATQSRQEETATEAIQAITERVTKDVQDNGGDIQTITNQIINGAKKVDLDLSEYVTQAKDANGDVQFIPKNEEALSEIIKIGVAYDFPTSDSAFEQAKKDSRKGINKLINANNALAVYDYVQLLPFTSYWGSAMKGVTAKTTTKAAEKAAQTAGKVHEPGTFTKILDKVTKGKFTPAQEKLAKITLPNVVAIKDKAIKDATAKMLGKDIARTLKARDIAKYLGSKAKLVAGEGVIEGFEEVNQQLLTNRYKAGEYDSYKGDASIFDVNELFENIALSTNSLGYLLGINSSDVDNPDNELRKAFNIGFASSILFSGVSHAAKNIYGADENNISQLLTQLKDDTTLGKVFAEQQGNIQDQVHLGVFYDAMQRGKKSASYMKERLGFLKKNLDKENSLVTEGFIDADEKLVDAMDLVLHNKNLKEIIDSYNPKASTKKANKESKEDAKKRMYVNAAKAVADANNANELVSSINNEINTKLNNMYRTIDVLFMDGEVSEEQLKQFKDDNPKLYNAVQLALNEYAQYKQKVLNQYEKNKKDWVSEHRKSAGVLDVDFSEEYDQAQIDQMEKELKDNKSFSTNPFVLQLARNEAQYSTSQAQAAKVAELGNIENRRNTIERAYQLKKSGFSQNDFVKDRLYALNFREQKRAVDAVKNMLQYQEVKQQRISELTGLDIDANRIIGMEKAVDEYIDDLNKSIGYFYNGADLETVLNADYNVDEKFISQEDLQSLMFAKAIAKPANIRKNAYLYGEGSNPISIRDFLNAQASEGLITSAKEYAKLIDDLKNGSLSDDVMAVHDNEAKLKSLSKKAARELILSEIKDQEKRRYIANKRKESEPISINDVELAQNGDTEAQARLNKHKADNETADNVTVVSEGEKLSRDKFNGGQKLTTSEKKQKIKDQRDMIEKYKKAAQNTPENETLVDQNGDQEEGSIANAEDLKEEFVETLAESQDVSDEQPLDQEEQLTPEEVEQPGNEDLPNDSTDQSDEEDPQTIPSEDIQPELSQNEDVEGELSEESAEEGELSQTAQEETLFEENESQDVFFAGAEEEAFHGLTIEPELSLDGSPIIVDKDDNLVDPNLVNGQVEQLQNMENGTLDQSESSFDGTKKTATEDTIGDMISETLFYDPDPKDDKGNSVDEPIKLRVNGKDVKLPKTLASGRKLAEKLTEKGWFTGVKKYWIVTQSLEAQNTRHTEQAKDAMTVCLILEDDNNCYAVTYRQLGEIHSVVKDSKGNVVEHYPKDKEQQLRDELYVKGMRWKKLIELGQIVGIQVPKAEPKSAKDRAKIAKPVFKARAKQIARGTFVGDPTLGNGNDSQFERWFKGLKPTNFKLKENDPEYLRLREQRENILEQSYESARRYTMKGGRSPITMAQIDTQIEKLRKNRNAVIDAYLTKIEDKNGKVHYQFPEEVRTDVIPNNVTQSNGRINHTTIAGTAVHKFHNLMPDKTMEQIAEDVESGKVVFGFGLGKFGSEQEAIQQLFTQSTERTLLRTPDGKSIGIGKAGKIYILVDTPNDTRVPIMLMEQKFNRQYKEVNGKLQKIYLDDDNSWKASETNGKRNDDQFKECFEIDPNTGRPRLIEDNEGYRPSIAEVMFYMVCGKFDTPNNKIDPEYFIHSGARTLIEGTDKFESANLYLGSKQLYFGPVDQNGNPLQIQNNSQEIIPMSRYGLIIGMKNNNGEYQQRVFMHDELFSVSEEAANDRREVIKAIAQQMHWSMDAFLLTEHSDVQSFNANFGSFVKQVFDQNKGKEECSFYGCPELTFNRSDFYEANSGDLNKNKSVQYFAWCLKNGKLKADVDLEHPFYAPFVFGNGVKETQRKIANEAADKLGATVDQPAQLTKTVEVTKDELMHKNAEYDEAYWTNFLGDPRKSMYDRVVSFMKSDNEKEQLFEEINKRSIAKEHNGYKDIVVFRLPKDNIPSSDVIKYIDEKMKEFVEKYNSLHKEETPIKYDSSVLDVVKTRLSVEYANRKCLPVMYIFNDGFVKVETKPMSGQFMRKDAGEGFTGMYSTKRGSGKVDIAKSMKWLQEKLGLREDQVIVTKAIMRGVHDETVFGLVNISADAVRNSLLSDGYIMLSRQSGVGVEYHEGWHFVNLLMHDKQTRRAIHDSYIKTHKKLQRPGVTYNDVEEAMAEDFRKWVLNQEDTSIIGKVKRAFNAILDFLFHTEDKKLYKQIYKDIHSGKYQSVPLDRESVKEFHERYNKQGGIYSKVHGIPGISDKTLENMPHVLTQTDFFEALDGTINAISNVLNLDSIEKIKMYSGKSFDEIVQIVKDLRDRQTEDRNIDILDDIINNPSIIKKALQDYLLSLGINFKVKKVKQEVTKLDGDTENSEIEIGEDTQDEALKKEDSPDNTWDKIDLKTSHKDNAALRAKMFLKRVPMLRRTYNQDGSVSYVEVLDKFGTPAYWKYDEVWNLVMNRLWSCDTLDAKNEETGEYLPKSIRGEVKKLAKSNAMFYALDQKFDDIEDDIELRSQVFTTISASKNPVMLGRIQDEITKVTSSFEEDYSPTDDASDARSMEDNGAVADRKRVFTFNNDDSIQVARNVPRTWSKNAALNGLVIYNAKKKTSTISSKFANSVFEKKQNLLKLIGEYKSKKLKKGHVAHTEQELRKALYGKGGIRELFSDLCTQLGIPVDNDVIDAYVAMYTQSKEGLTLQQQINIFSDIMSDANGSLPKIIDDVYRSAGTEELMSSDKRNRELDQLFNSYSEDSNIGKLAIAYNNIHPELAEYAVKDANGNMIYPINMPNELTDKTNDLNKNTELAQQLAQSKLCEHSVVIEASMKVDKNNPHTQLRLNTFAGLKDDNKGEGADHAGLTALEDVLCKMFLTEMDHIIFPTMADKKTWQSLSSSNLKLSHDLILTNPRKTDELPFILEEYKKIKEYNEANYKDKFQYNREARDWYNALPNDSEVKKSIFNKALEVSIATGQISYKRFSDNTLTRFAKFFLDEINALIDYYDENHIANLVADPNKLITNFHGEVSNGRMDFSGNGGKFRYFYDTYVSKDFAVKSKSGVSENVINALDMNLNQKLNALYELQKQIESVDGVETYTRDRSGEKQIDPAFSKLTTIQALGKPKEMCDGFELIREFLKDLKSEVVKNGEFTQTVLDCVNDKLIRLTEESLRQFSQPGDIMQMVSKNDKTGLYTPTKVPAQLLKPYFEKLIQSGLISEYSTIYSSDKNDDEEFAEIQSVYSLFANFTVNTILSVMEVEKIYTGEKAQYKCKKTKSQLPVRLRDYSIGGSLVDVTVNVEMMDDVFSDKIKRLGGTQSPGNKLRSDFSESELEFDPTLRGNKYTVCNVEDIEIPSAHLDIIYQNFKTQLVIDRLRRGDIVAFEQYVSEQIQNRKEENIKLKEEGKSLKSDLTRERVIDRLYNNYNLVNQFYDSLSDSEKSKINVELAAQCAPYTNITVSDAQVFIRPALYRKMRIRLGEWSIEPDESGYSDEIAYRICESDDLWMKDPKKAMIVSRFQINALKMSYFQNSPFDDAGIHINKAIYNKMALFPLFKMHRSTDVGRMLYDRMNLKGQEIDQIAFKSAVKVGSVKKAPSVEKNLSGIEDYVKTEYGISKSKWKELSSSEKLEYYVKYSKSEEVKNALSNLNDKLGVTYNGDKITANYANQYSVDYTTDRITDNKTLNTLPISVQDLHNIRLQLNTRAHEADSRAIGTQMFKLAFSNIIDNAEYGTEKSGRQSRLGSAIKEDITRCILRITNIGIDEIRNEFYNKDGKLNKKAVQDYVKTIAINNGLGEAAQQLLAEGAVAAALMSRSVFEHSVSSQVNKKIVDINTSGGTAIQQSIFGFAGYDNSQISTYYNNLYQVYNNGKELNWNAEEGSMEVLLSMNFFRRVVPRNVWSQGHNARRQWLIDNDVIKGTKTDGTQSNPKPFGIGYRIPTQGMSSMFAYRVADVLPEQVGDLIVVPREFTAQTGSDFDVDKLFLANYSYKITDTDSTREVEQRNADDTIGAIGNTLLDNYIDIISDRRNFANARASIDVITNTIQSELLPVLRGSNNEYISGMSELLPYFQTLRKLEFGVGKTGIGPFALNVTNLSLTQYMHLTMDFGQVGKDFDLWALDSIEGQDGRRISDWLSAMVNAHVDVAKDAYVRDLNVNQFTYNHANLLLRCGKGITTFSFLAQPALKQLADLMNNSGGIYGDNYDGNSPTQEGRERKKNKFQKRICSQYRYLLENLIKSDKLSSDLRANAIKTIEWVRWNYPKNEEFEAVKKEKQNKENKSPELPLQPKDMFDFNKATEAISTLRNSSDVNKLAYAYMYQIQAINSLERLDKYAQSLSELVQCSQIDTKKFGNTIALHRNFANKMGHFIAKNDMWVINDPEFIKSVPLRKDSTKPLKKDVSYTALKKYFSEMYLDKKFQAATKYTKGILEHQLFCATDAYDNIFTTVCSVMFGKESIECIDGKTYDLYGTIYKEDTLTAIAGGIDDIVRYNVFVNQGPMSLQVAREHGNNDAIDFIGSGKDYIRQNMKRLLFGNNEEQPIFNRVANLIKDIKKNPYSKDGYLDLIDENGNISNQFLLYLSPQTANANYPVGRMLLSTSQMSVSTYTKRQLMAGFDQLLSSEDEEIRKLAQDLAFYAYFSTYDQNVVNGFFDLVPPDYRKQYDAALKYALNHNHKADILSAITGQHYSQEQYQATPDSVEKDMVSSASNEIIDILSRNFWYNDNIVNKFFTRYDYNKNTFKKDSGDIVPVGIYDAVSQRSFQPWIATTNSDATYFKVQKGKTTMLYKKIGVVSKTEKNKDEGKAKTIEFNVYAVVQKAGLHKGKINQYEFYCNANTPSIFEDNQIMDPEFAIDNVQKAVLSELKDLDNDENYSYSFDLFGGTEIDPMYVSTNTETYYHDPLATATDHSKKESTLYATFERSCSSADRKGIQNSDWVINLVTEDKGAEVNRSVSKPLQEIQNISDATLDANTTSIVQQIVETGKQNVTIYITSTFAGGLQSSEEEIQKVKQEKRAEYVAENSNINNVQELADKYVAGLSDYDIDQQLLEEKISTFLDKLIYDLNIAGVKVKRLSAPLGKNRKPVAFSVISAHKTHSDFFEETKATIYPVDKFVNGHKKSFHRFIERVQNMIEDSQVTEGTDDVIENSQPVVDAVEKQATKDANTAKNKFNKFTEADKKELVNDQDYYRWSRYGDEENPNNNYEVSSKGHSEFSALNAIFKPGTVLFGHDVGNRTIESVYQHGVKQGDWNTDNNSKTGAPGNKEIITGDNEDASYEQGYLPLWKEWAKQNPEKIESIRKEAAGKILTDRFAKSRVSQARALADILNNGIEASKTKTQKKNNFAAGFVEDSIVNESSNSNEHLDC